MATYRARGVSPPPRKYGDPSNPIPPVFSTGFDTRFAQQSRSGLDSLTTSSRLAAERLVDAQPISRREIVGSGHSGAQSKTEYAVRRPRHSSVSKDDARTPLRILAPPTSLTRSRPLVDNSPYDQPRSPHTQRYYPSKEPDRYILPAISSPRHHGRQVGDSPLDPSHSAVAGRDRRERVGYRAPGSHTYPIGGALVRYDDEDFSYTSPREQFDRDYPPPEARRRSNSYVRQDRPTSTSKFDDWNSVSQSRQEQGPPPTVRQFDRLNNGEPRLSNTRSSEYSDHERDWDKPKRRNSLRTPAPVSLHQDRKPNIPAHTEELPAWGAIPLRAKAYDEEPSYSSDRENYRPSSHYERHQQRSKVREESRDRAGKSNHGTATAGLAGLTAIGLGRALIKKHRDRDDDFDRDESREYKDRYVRESDARTEDTSRERERMLEKPTVRAAEGRDEPAHPHRRRENRRKEKTDSDSVDDIHADGHRRRRKQHHPQRHSKSQELDSDSTSDERKRNEKTDEANQARLGKDAAPKESKSGRRERSLSNAHEHDLAEDDRSMNLPVRDEKHDDEEDRAVCLQLVEPPKDKEPEPKPRGILKPARQVPFPEDPNPTREGVAPLKDAGKKGIPPGARWTKINRMLVNPAALIAAHERYEERDEYVVVLRVLSREEIQKFADMTKEIRGKTSIAFLFP